MQAHAVFEKTWSATQKNVKSHVFLKSEKNEKYVFSNTGLMQPVPKDGVEPGGHALAPSLS